MKESLKEGSKRLNKLIKEIENLITFNGKKRICLTFLEKNS